MKSKTKTTFLSIGHRRSTTVVLAFFLATFSSVPTTYGQEMTEEEWENRGKRITLVSFKDLQRAYPVGDWDKENPGQEFRTNAGPESHAPVNLDSIVIGELWDRGRIRVTKVSSYHSNPRVRTNLHYRAPNYGSWFAEVAVEAV
ncbi:MAG: hypothetical protein MPJ24_11620, partial [Pirellulaceae bacterium]|nr:hypothetical protein [Pirellulaceae bacterium]